MWAALKADMSEFVSTVKAETTETLNIIDQGLDDVNDDHNDASGAMIDLGTGMVIDDADVEQEPVLPSKEEMLEYLHSCQALYLDPLSEQEEAVMASFSLDEKTQEISQLLEENPDTLRATFEQLTSEVEYADFWKRYYCRLADDKLEETYTKYYEEKKGPSALSSVTNFLGGAVARLVEEGEEVSNRTGEASAKSALGFLTGGGRPPFVLNTADSGDLDEEYEGEQQQPDSFDEEEDFGWGEDSDEDDDELDDDDGGEVVEFRDTEKEDLKEKLQQALDERNQLQKTIEMQAGEIKELKVNAAAAEKGEATAPSEPAAPAPADAALKEELEALKMEMFEKDSELAGLKLKMEDNKMENQHQKEEIAEQMQTYLKEKDETIAKLQAELDAMKENASSANDAQLEQSKKENEELRTSMNDFVHRWEQQEAKNTAANQALEESLAENDKLDAEVKSLKDQVAALQQDLESANATAAAASQGDGALQEELTRAKQEISTLQREASTAKSQVEGLQQENQTLSSDLAESQSKVEDLNKNLEQASTAKGQVEGLQKENQTLSSELAESQSKMEGLSKNLEQAKSLLQQAAASAAELDAISKEKEALTAELESEKAKRSSLEQELQSSKALLQQTQTELMETKTHASAGSQSTGIKLESTSIPEATDDVMQENGNGDDDDDVGDDWGDDW